MNETYLERQDVLKLENQATNLRDKLLVRILFHLGCRVSEALAIEVDDIDFENGTVTIEHLKVRISLLCKQCSASLGRSHAFCPKCGTKIEGALAAEQQRRRMRTLPADRETLSILQEYVRRGGPVVKDGKRLIFGMSRHRAWQVVRDLAMKAGLPTH